MAWVSKIVMLPLQVTEIFNFSQDDLMTEDIFILDCQSEIFVWVGQQVDSKSRMQALNIAEVFDLASLGHKHVKLFYCNIYVYFFSLQILISSSGS